MKGQYRNLVVWQKAHLLVLEVYRITTGFPKSEEYALLSQVRRSVVSVAANIVEGCAKTPRMFLNHLLIAQGSLEETRYYISEVATDLGYLSKEHTKKASELIDEVGKMVYSLIKKLR